MRRVLTSSAVLLGLASAALAAPGYTISAFAPVGADTVGSGNWISPNGSYATGFSQHGNPNAASNAILYAVGGATPATLLPNLVTTSPTHPFHQGLAVNNSGTAVGAAYSTTFFSAPLPVIWQNNAVAQLPFPANFTAGRAYAVNNGNVAVGSGSGNASFPETAIRFTSGGSTALAQLSTDGGRLQTAFGISDAGDIVGTATNPATAAANVPFYLPAGASVAQVIPPTSAANNGGIAFAVSQNGRYVVGSSSFNGGAGVPSLYDLTTNANVAVPLPANSTSASLRAVNNAGHAVGVGSGQFAVPFYFDGTDSYALNELFNDATWNVVANTSSAAYSISNGDVIVGRAFHNGVLSAFTLTPTVPEPATFSALMIGAMILRRRRAPQRPVLTVPLI